MQRVIYAILALSLVVNGGMAGLIAGHLLAAPAACRCDNRWREPDPGPYPTGWVVPDSTPKKPSGKPSGAMP